MKKHFKNLWTFVKSLLAKHKRLFKGILIAAISKVCVVALLWGLCFAYSRVTYSEDIDLVDAYYSTEELDFTFSERDEQAEIDSSGAESILVENNQIRCNNESIIVEDHTITLTTSGTYILKGELNDGSIIIDAAETDKIQLVLDAFSLSNSNGPAIYARSADKVFITTTAGTTNRLTDGTGYSLLDGDTNVDGAVFSKADLALNGLGTLIVQGKTAHGIVSKDDLIIASGTYEIESVKKGICGKDCIKIADGSIQINAGTDGMCSDNEEDDTRGYIYIKSGNIRISCDNDGIQAQNTLVCDHPNIEITSRDGASNAPVKEGSHGKGKSEDDAAEELETAESAKGLKSARDIIISGGVYTIDSFDDAVHSDHSIKIANGNFTVKSGDDAFHAEHTLQVAGGSIHVSRCFEGLEGFQISISGGDLTVVSSDDGVNASSGGDTFSTVKGVFNASCLGKFEMTGGQLSVDASGDALDSNGVMNLLGGVILLSGPSGHGDGLVDCDSGAVVDGGTVLCIGLMEDDAKSGRTTSDDYFCPQNQLQITRVTQLHQAGAQLELFDSQGKQLAVYHTPQPFNYVVTSAPEFQAESDCIIKINGADM